ncbi:MAG: hypothetical protein HC842_07395 [Cytophagales bacterium]|nr:hypothetical protein [Cytophagales bacterium]
MRQDVEALESPVIKQDRTLTSSFDQISAMQGIELMLSQASETQLSVEAPEKVLPRIITEVKEDGRLVIRKKTTGTGSGPGQSVRDLSYVAAVGALLRGQRHQPHGLERRTALYGPEQRRASHTQR